MSRSRGTVAGGYVRRTVSLPKALDDEFKAYLENRPGSTFSAVMTVAGENFLREQKPKRDR